MRLLEIFEILLLMGLVQTLEYNMGGADWTGVCALGSNQSPIDIPTSWDSKSVNAPRLRYSESLQFVESSGPMSNLSMADQTFLFQVNFNDGAISMTGEDGRTDTFRLSNFHIHSPSEHTFNGKHYDAELHFSYKHFHFSRGAMLAFFFDMKKGGDKTIYIQETNDFISSLQVQPLNQSTKGISLTTVPAQQFLSQVKYDNLYYYHGSLTIPPCSEATSWILVDDPQPISKEQLLIFQNRLQNNISFAGDKNTCILFKEGGVITGPNSF